MSADLIAPLRALVEQAKAAVETIDGEFGMGRSYGSLLTEGDANAQKVQAAEQAIDALVVMLEPPTDDEREAVAKVLRGMLEPISGDPVTNPEWVAAAIVSSEPWRNRHRGPITDEIIQRACRAHYVEVWGDDLDPEYVFPPADVRAMRAALEAGSNGHRGSITRGGEARHVDALRDLAEHGLRFDLNPTMAITTADEVYAQWAAYARRMDESVRAHARAALAVAEAAQ